MLTAFVLISSIVAGDGDLREQPSRAPTTVSAKRRCKGKKCRSGSRAPRVDPALLAAETARREALAEVEPLLDARRFAAVAARLSQTAALQRDPVLHLAAAEAHLAAAPLEPAGLAGADADVRRAEALRADPERAPIHARTEPLVDRAAQELGTFVRAQRELLAQRRRGRTQLITGGVFVLVAASGVGAAIGGAVTLRRLEDARSQYAGAEYDDYRASLAPLERRGETMLAAGVVTAVLGASVGVTLTVIGGRELRKARHGQPERPQFHFLPALSGFRVIGRF
ncbi:hypothetical protein [Nannocystis radixulma]|uniref:Uncharacterized protein n=1 Tax=Nannocystis radixulma TaxID=2995305 RepID=A0ABT5BJ71_9BACT|nr:hypothetical protein [Nannocystis radixulma]MDC0673448.1 hypothetical protein [Nannocystis radixulma]